MASRKKRYYKRKKTRRIRKYKGGSSPLVTVFLMCFNEERIIDFTVNYYKKQFPDCKITICDNESNDSSVEIAKSLGCEIFSYTTGGAYSEEKLLETKNTVWKLATTPWVIVCDMDEILTANQNDIIAEDAKGVTILKTKGYEVYGNSKKADLSNTKSNLDSITKGEYSHGFNKLICFNRLKITDINYGAGAHSANPKGIVKYSDKEYFLYHYKKLGYEYLKYTHDKVYNRVKFSRDNDIVVGSHYTDDANEIRRTMSTDNKPIETIPALKTFYMKGGADHPFKVAILFGGRIVGYENVKDNLVKIMNQYNPTVFCSLNKKNKSDYIKGFCDLMKIDDERLHLEITPPPPEKYYTIVPRHSVDFDVTRFYSLLYHQKLAFLLLEKYQEKHNMKFDCILFYRADIQTTDDLKLQLPKPNTIYVPIFENAPHEHANNNGIMCGQYYGDYDVMKYMCNIIDSIKDLSEKDGVPFGFPEVAFKKHMDNKKFHIERFQYKFEYHESRHKYNPAYDDNE